MSRKGVLIVKSTADVPPPLSRVVFSKSVFALLAASLVVMISNTSCGQESLPILEYLGQRAARMAAELPPVPNSRDAWEKHRTELLKELAVVLSLPAREPMKAAVTDKKQQGDVLIEEVAYIWAGKTYVSATVIRGGRARSSRLQPRGRHRS